MVVLNKLLIPSETMLSFLTRKFVESNIIMKNSTFLDAIVYTLTFPSIGRQEEERTGGGRHK